MLWYLAPSSSLDNVITYLGDGEHLTWSLNLSPLVRVASVGFRKGCVCSHCCCRWGMLSWVPQQGEGWAKMESPPLQQPGPSLAGAPIAWRVV